MSDMKTIFKIATRAIKANKMRSVLTSLGIIIGVAAVIVMLAIGNGAQISLQNEMKSMGQTLLLCDPEWQLQAVREEGTDRNRQ